MVSVKFNDGELIQFEKGWNDLPNKPILRVKITIDKHMLMMEGYEEYNHLQEYCMNLDGNKTLRYRYLLGKKGDRVKAIIYNYIDDKIKEYETEFGKEYGATFDKDGIQINGRPSTGWKEGVKEGNIEYFYF
jgi:hypothetical protein